MLKSSASNAALRSRRCDLLCNKVLASKQSMDAKCADSTSLLTATGRESIMLSSRSLPSLRRKHRKLLLSPFTRSIFDTMKISYDPEIDAVYIRLIEGKHECRTLRLNEEIALNIGEGEKLVGIEILDAKKVLGSGELPNVVLENLSLAKT